MNLKKRQFGDTGLEVSALGYGAANIGDPRVPEKQAEYMLNLVLDLGINLIDTARAYGLSEERIGKYISKRRDEFLISTKVGYGIEGVEDWTYDSVLMGVDNALRLMQTEHLDIVHLHTCSESLLVQGDVIKALEKAKEQGKINVIAFTGDNSAIYYAMRSQKFAALLTSINICDQRFIDHGLAESKDKKLAIMAKRPLANAPWRFDKRPHGHYCEEYWHRLKTMNLDTEGLSFHEVFLRFAAFTYGVDSCIVGTNNEKHLRENIEAIEKGKLSQSMIDTIRLNFREYDFGWNQLT